MEEKKIGIPLEGLAEFSRIAAAQGAVLLKNEGKILPFTKEDNISVFGRCQKDYYRSGTGSGGAVNIAYTTNLLDGLRASSKIRINEELASIYEEFIRENPFDNGGGGWAAEPWYQEEMPLTKETVVSAAEVSNKALVVIGRTAGEDKDNADKPGSYRLTEKEMQMLSLVCREFDKVVLAMNVANIVDMSWLEEAPYKENIKGVIYLWHGGIEGGNAAADVLCGRVTPSGKLADTIAYSLQDYPSTVEYGNKDRSLYFEDIYVGYRYFETFCPEKVQFPFGFGLSYTEFSLEQETVRVKEGTKGDSKGNFQGNSLEVRTKVTNTGTVYAGKEVVQVYVEAPQGKLGKPAKELVGYAKTRLLSPGESQEVIINVPFSRLASYDDSGVTGYKSCYVLEAGEYKIHVGNGLRETKIAAVEDEKGTKNPYFTLEEVKVVEQLTEAAAPVEAFARLKPGRKKEDGLYEETFEPVPLSTVNLAERIQKDIPSGMPITGDKGIRFADVKAGKETLDDFVAQLQVSDLAAMVRGEGMGSTKVTPGTASAFGGVTNRLLSYGIPVGCAADGPSGIRMDTGHQSTQVPIGTLLACTWDAPLVEELFTLQGQELLRNEIDTLLGPGINLHRNPLNGRNFEYFSEDPLVTGMFAAAVAKGIGKSGSQATIKHFACNSQEYERFSVNAVISERALRELYLKGFEIAVKEGGGKSIMTAYNPINGYWSATHYDLTTTILRKEWGFDGIVMTDWWARLNDVVERGEPGAKDTRSMIRAQNDLYMVVNNYGAELNPNGDNTEESVENGKLTIGELQRSARNILRFLLASPASERSVKVPEKLRIPVRENAGEGTLFTMSEEADREGRNGICIPVDEQCGGVLEGIQYFSLQVPKSGVYGVNIKISSTASERAQMVCQASLNGVMFSTFQTNGTNGKWLLQKLTEVELEEGFYELKLRFIGPGMQIEFIEFSPID